MKAWDILGYGFDGACYCTSHVPKARETGCTNPEEHADQWGTCAENCHGYGPNPIFAGDEDAGSETCDVEGCGYIDPDYEPPSTEEESTDEDEPV